MSAPSTPTPPTRSAAPAALSAGPPSTPSKLAAPPPPPAHSLAGHLRATALFIVLTLLVSAFGYPLFVTGIAQVIEPASANGSLLKDPNGTIIGSSLIAQNTSAPYLFWERPSPTDYNTTDGMVTPYGATDPALLNETLAYMAQYGNFTVNATLPFWLVSQSGSSIDPDLTPEAVLVQVPAGRPLRERHPGVAHRVRERPHHRAPHPLPRRSVRRRSAAGHRPLALHRTVSMYHQIFDPGP